MSIFEAEWQQLYDMIPKIDCKRLCSHACGPIGMTRAEFNRIGKNLKTMDDGEDVYLMPKPDTLSCPLLEGTKCSVYDRRPMICRLYGVTEKLACVRGCIPERWLNEEETRALLLEAEELNRKEIAEPCSTPATSTAQSS